MDDGQSWIKIIIFLIFIILDAIFFGFGSAIQNVNSSQLEKDMEEGDIKAGRILRIVNRPGRFINTIQLVSKAIAYTLGALIFFDKDLIKHLIEAAFSLTVLVSFGIVIPKRLACKWPRQWAYATYKLVYIIMIAIYPIVFIINSISYLVLRLFGIDMNKNEDNVTEEDIMSMVNEGHEQGVLESSEAQMITNIFELNDKKAVDIMTHRKNLVAINGEDSLSTVVDFILNTGNNSRYPVYTEDVDNITGIINMKDALIFSNKGRYKDKSINEIRGLLRQAHFIPESRSVDTLFKEMQSKKIHMVIVVDEYGQTAGIVTMEDILEEIVGNIMDEYDIEEELIIKNSDGSLTIKGMANLEDVAEALDIEFDKEEYDNFDTLNGLLISKLDRIPIDGEKFKIYCHDFLFNIISVENKMIKSVRVIKSDIKEDADADE